MGTVKIEIKWGIILAVITFVVFTLSSLLGWQTVETMNLHLSVAFAAFLIGNLTCLWLGLREKRNKDLGGLMSYGQGFKAGAIITVVATVLGALFLYCFTVFVNTEFLNANTDFLIAEGKMEVGQVLTASAFLTEFSTHSLVLGLVFSLIIAFFAKKGVKS